MKNREPCTTDLRYCFLQSETSRALDDTCLYKSSLVSRCEHKPKGRVSERKKKQRKQRGSESGDFLTSRLQTSSPSLSQRENKGWKSKSHLQRLFWVPSSEISQNPKNLSKKKKKQRWAHICVSIVSKPQTSCALFACTPDKNKLGGRGKLLVHESTCIYEYILQFL